MYGSRKLKENKLTCLGTILNSNKKKKKIISETNEKQIICYIIGIKTFGKQRTNKDLNKLFICIASPSVFGGDNAPETAIKRRT